MPPYLAIPHYHLSKLPVTTKVAVTGFTLSIVAAIFFVGFAVFADRTGWETEKVQAHFAGDEEFTKATGKKPDGMYDRPSRRAIYDIVHPHSFMMPIIYFVLCHMMEMSYAPRMFKIGVYAVGFVSMMVSVFAPLLVWTNIALGPVVVPAVTGMLLAFLIMCLLPTWQMWMAKDPVRPLDPAKS